VGMSVKRHAAATLSPGMTRDPLTAGWVGGPVWNGTENLAPTGIRSPQHPTSSEFRLFRYSGPQFCDNINLQYINTRFITWEGTLSTEHTKQRNPAIVRSKVKVKQR